jgi:pre-mRNA processing factor 4 (PRP4)-like protein
MTMPGEDLLKQIPVLPEESRYLAQKAKSINLIVPTRDDLVQSRLRELDQPIILFAEDVRSE